MASLLSVITDVLGTDSPAGTAVAVSLMMSIAIAMCCGRLALDLGTRCLKESP